MRQRAYHDDRKLAVRQHLHQFTTTPLPSKRGRIFSVFEPRGDEVVIDVGCGNGNDLRSLAAAGHAGPLVGVDISTGMLESVDVPEAALVCGDAANLPLDSNTGDIVMAMSMLYHVADLDAALGELRRITREGGTFLASAASASNMREFVAVWERATVDIIGRPLDIAERWARRFNTENGSAVLRRHFSTVELHTFHWTVEPPDPRLVCDYAESSRDFYEDAYPPGAWDDVMDRLTSLVTEVFDRTGRFPIGIRKGIFVAR